MPTPARLNYLIRLGHAEVLQLIYGRVVVPLAVLIEMHHPDAPPEVRAWATSPGVSSGLGNNTMFNAVVESATTTQATIAALTPTAAVIGNLPLVQATTVTTVNVLAVGW